MVEKKATKNPGQDSTTESKRPVVKKARPAESGPVKTEAQSNNPKTTTVSRAAAPVKTPQPKPTVTRTNTPASAPTPTKTTAPTAPKPGLGQRPVPGATT